MSWKSNWLKLFIKLSHILEGALFLKSTSEPVLDFGPERGSAKGKMADLGPLGS